MEFTYKNCPVYNYDDFIKSFQLHRPLELLASQERNEIDGSEGAIITLRMIRECVSHVRRPFVMISRCNGVRAKNSCREFLVLLSAQKYKRKVTHFFFSLIIVRVDLLLP